MTKKEVKENNIIERKKERKKNFQENKFKKKPVQDLPEDADWRRKRREEKRAKRLALEEKIKNQTPEERKAYEERCKRKHERRLAKTSHPSSSHV